VRGVLLGTPIGCRLRLQNLIQNCGGYLILYIGLLVLPLLCLVFALLCLVFGFVILLLLPLNFLQVGLLQSILDLLSLQLVLCNELITCLVIQASQGFILSDNPTYCLQGVKLLPLQGWNMLRTALKIPSNSTKMAEVQVRSCDGENMQSVEVRSSQVCRNGGRSSLAIPRFGNSSWVKYLHKKMGPGNFST
jgi:hypothetical protein